MLRDILHESLERERDVQLVGEASDLADLKRLLRAGGVDVVVLGLSDADLPATLYQLFEVDARVRILAIAAHGRSASLYELRPDRLPLGEGSPQELMQVVRDRMRWRWDRDGATASPGD
jgi:DNA-binding NarL/FixJ family response regulator